ncbi:MAG: energy transducer TonB [Thalassobaculum sp.]
MPEPADRLHMPAHEAPRRGPVLAALAVAASVAAHGVAMAAVAGFWNHEAATTARPVEVVMVTVTRPERPAAPAAAFGGPAPNVAQRSDAPESPPIRQADAESARGAHRVTAIQPARVERLSQAAPVESLQVAATPIEPAPVEPAPIEPAPIEAVPMASTALQSADVERRTETTASFPSIGRPPHPVARPTETDRTPAADRLPTPSSKRPSGGSTAPPARASSQGSATLAALSGPSDAAPATGVDGRAATFELGSAGNPAPDYPYRARQRGWEGRVVLRVAIDDRGRPVDIDIATSSGHGILDRAAHQTVAGWTFRPATRDGRPVAGEAIVPIVFRLN